MWDSPSQQPYLGGYISPNQYQNFPISNNVNSSTAVDSLDWPFLDNIDPALCSTREYKHILKEISRTFVRTTIINLGTPERMVKLLKILQIIITTLSSRCDKYADEIEDLRNKYRILHKKYENASNKPSKVQNIIADRCPICQNPFKTLQHLDLHVFSKHTEVSTLWQAIRTPQPPGAFAFPWQKSHSITSTVYPQSTQNYNDQTVQNLLEDFRKKFFVEQKESEKQMQEWIDKKMTKVESKIDTLQQTAKKEIINTKIGLDDQIQNKSNYHRKKREKERNKNHRSKQPKSNSNVFDTQNPFNQFNGQQNVQYQPPQNYQTQPSSQNNQHNQPNNQTSQTNKQSSQQNDQNSSNNQPNQANDQIYQNLSDQKSPQKDQQEPANQPIKFYDNGSNHSNSNKDIDSQQKPLQNSVSGSIVSLEQTSNTNFISPEPKTVASGSDAEYESPPEDDQNRQQPSKPPTTMSGSQSQSDGFQSNQKVQNPELNGTQNSENSQKRYSEPSEFNMSQSSDVYRNQVTDNNRQNADFLTPQKKDDRNRYDNDGVYNEDYSNGSNRSNRYYNDNPNGDNFKYNDYNDYDEGEIVEDGEIVDDGNFVTSYVQPPADSHNDDDEEGVYNIKSDASDNYTKQLENLNDSDLYRATPPPGKALLRHSSSAEERKETPVIKNHKEIDDDYEYYYSDVPNNFNNFNNNNNLQHFDKNDDLINKNDEYDEYLENLDHINSGDVVSGIVGDVDGGFNEDEIHHVTDGKRFNDTRDEGLMGSSFNIDSLPQPDLPDFSDSPSAKKPKFGKKTTNSNKSKKEANKPSEKFRKETYNKDDLAQMYNDIINSDEY